MHWTIYSALMFLSSILYYLFIKKVQKLGIDRRFYMLANFSIPTLLYFLYNLYHRYDLADNIKIILLALFVGLVLNFSGSILSYISIQKAPNAGYALVIQKSYAIYTTFFAIILFNAEINILKILATLIVILGIGILSTGKMEVSKSYTPNKQWIILSAITFFCFGSNSIAAKLAVEWGGNATVYLFWVMLFTAIASAFDLTIYHKNVSFDIGKKGATYLLSMSIAVSCFYFFKQFSDVLAPNVGYSSAINASSNAVLTILMAIIFGDHLNLRKFLGVLAVITGILVIMLG